jgi:hypothetical protein
MNFTGLTNCAFFDRPAHVRLGLHSLASQARSLAFLVLWGGFFLEDSVVSTQC